jgi:hypothetical protein
VNGTLHLDWQLGAVAALENAESPAAAVPAALGRFDRWTGDAEIANGTITLKQNQVQQGFRKRAVQGALTLGDHPTVSFVAPSETQAKR